MVGYESFSMRRSPWRLYSSYLLPANISVKTAETSTIRVSWKIGKTHFQDTLKFKLLAVFARIQPFPRSNGLRTGRPSRLNLRGITYTFLGAGTEAGRRCHPTSGCPRRRKLGLCLERCRKSLRQNGLFLSFPYVCPEPVLVK